MFKRSFAFRIFLLNFGLLILPVIFYFFLVFRLEFDSKIERALFELQDIGEAKASVLGEVIDADFNALNFLDLYLNLKNEKVPVEQIQGVLERVLQGGGFTAVSYYERVGDTYIAKASTDKQIINQDFSYRGYVQYAAQNGRSVHLAYGGPPHHWPLLFAVKSIYNDNHEVIGMFVAVNMVKDLFAALADVHEFSPFARFSILTESDITFVSSDPDFTRVELKPITKERVAEIEKDKQFSDFPLKQNYINFEPVSESVNTYKWTSDGDKRIGVWIPVPSSDFSVLLDESESAIAHKFYSGFWKIAFYFFIIIIVVGILNILLIRRLSMPLKKLVYVMHQIGKGDYKFRYQKEPFGFEINRVGETLNQMTEKLVHFVDSAREERLKREMLSNELRIGREIQKSILPQEMPLCEGIEIAAHSIPAQEVAGDFFDIYMKENEKMVVTVGDTSGKGISACLYSFCLRSMLRSYGMRYDDLTMTMHLANSLFCLDTAQTSTFVTAMTVAYTPSKGILEYSCGGHIPGIIVREDGSIFEFSTPGVALGAAPESLFQMQQTTLSQGDLVVIYTDGLTQIFKKEHFLQFLIDYRKLSAEEIVTKIFEELKSFEAKILDDITLVMLKTKSL